MIVILWIERLHRALGALSGVAILAITLLVVADIVLRSLFNSPIPGATEASTLLMVAVVFLSLASVQAAKGNFRVEILSDALPRPFRRALDVLTTTLALAAIGVFAWFTTTEAATSFARREMSFGAVTFPVYPARIVIAVGLSLLALQLVLDLLRFLVGADANAPEGDRP